jgi:hypothetical protein
LNLKPKVLTPKPYTLLPPNPTTLTPKPQTPTPALHPPPPTPQSQPPNPQPYTPKVFSVPIGEHLIAAGRQGRLPLVAERCIALLRERALNLEGILRIAGSRKV